MFDFFICVILGCIAVILFCLYERVFNINDNIIDIAKTLDCSERRKNQLFDFLEEHSSFYRKRDKK